VACIRTRHTRSFTGGEVRMTHPIAFLSDFGYRNEWVGICHAVINKIAPESQVIDVSWRAAAKPISSSRSTPEVFGRWVGEAS
jgi:hypothetical protein